MLFIMMKTDSLQLGNTFLAAKDQPWNIEQMAWLRQGVHMVKEMC